MCGGGVERNGAVGKRWKGPVVGGPYGAVGLPVCMGLKPGTSDPTTGPEGKDGVVLGGAGTDVGLKGEACDATTGRDDEKGVLL